MLDPSASPAPELPPGAVASRVLAEIKRLPDDELAERLRRLDSLGRGIEAAFIAHLAEFDARERYKVLGHSSLFRYCVTVFGHSESRAYKRILAARAVRRFPLVLERLAAGRIHVSAVAVLAPHLTDENLIALLDAAEGKPKFELERLVAALAPERDRKDVIMRLPSLRPPEPSTERPGDIPKSETPPEAPETAQEPPAHADKGAAVRTRSVPAVVTPLSAERVHFGFTGSLRLREKLERVKALLWHKEPAGRLEVLIEALADEFLTRKDPGRARRTGPAAGRPPPQRSRTVPAAVRRAVWRRDGGACAYSGPDGRRCGERRGLEVDHVVPFARGGVSDDPANLRLLCRTHNQWAARRAGLGPSP